jgi:zinc/manganese transport system substrate-binding protein
MRAWPKSAEDGRRARAGSLPRHGLLWLPLLVCVLSWQAQAEVPGDDLSIVVAESTYGDIALQIAGPQAHITQILRDPKADPHRFLPDPATAKLFAGADLVIMNGLGYDAWMVPLLATVGQTDRHVVTVADILGRKAGDDPHLWYDPAAIPLLAEAIKQALSRDDPDEAKALRNRLRLFLASLKPLDDKVAAMRAKWTNTPVAATEPVFRPMAAALGLKMENEAFGQAVMAGHPPAAADITELESALREHRLRALLYNPQVTSAAAEEAVAVAKVNGVPVVTVREMRPPGVTYQDWMTGTLSDLDKALSR